MVTDLAASKRFVVLLFVLSIPFYAIGYWLQDARILPFGLPISATMIVLPSALGLWLNRRFPMAAELESHAPGLLSWLAGWGGALAVMPAASLLAWTVRWWSGHQAIPFALPPPNALELMVAVYLPGALLEEFGWTQFLTPRLQAALGIWPAGAAIGIVWAAWHIVPYAALQHHGWPWVVAQCTVTVTMRMLMGWLYARCGRSLAQAIAFHASINISATALPYVASRSVPMLGYDPAFLAPVLIALITILVSLECLSSGSHRDADKGG